MKNVNILTIKYFNKHVSILKKKKYNLNFAIERNNYYW